MHLHAVPWSNGNSIKASIDLPLKEIQSLNKLQEVVLRGNSYLLFIDQEDRKYIAENVRLPSQYMRRKLAEHICAKDWDWRIYQEEERLIRTYKKLSSTTANG